MQATVTTGHARLASRCKLCRQQRFLWGQRSEQLCFFSRRRLRYFFNDVGVVVDAGSEMSQLPSFGNYGIAKTYYCLSMSLVTFMINTTPVTAARLLSYRRRHWYDGMYAELLEK